MIEEVPEELLGWATIDVYRCVTISGWDRGWTDTYERCRSLARMALQAQRRHETPSEAPRYKHALARIRNICGDEAETIYAARALLRAIESVVTQALEERP